MKELLNSMKNCYQIEGKQTILQHGISVYNFYKDLFKTNQKKEWRLPDWLLENKEWIQHNIYSDDIIKKYTLFHDCGKPRCKIIDEYG